MMESEILFNDSGNSPRPASTNSTSTQQQQQQQQQHDYVNTGRRRSDEYDKGFYMTLFDSLSGSSTSTTFSSSTITDSNNNNNLLGSYDSEQSTGPIFPNATSSTPPVLNISPRKSGIYSPTKGNYHNTNRSSQDRRGSLELFPNSHQQPQQQQQQLQLSNNNGILQIIGSPGFDTTRPSSMLNFFEDSTSQSSPVKWTANSNNNSQESSGNDALFAMLQSPQLIHNNNNNHHHHHRNGDNNNNLQGGFTHLDEATDDVDDVPYIPRAQFSKSRRWNPNNGAITDGSPRPLNPLVAESPAHKPNSRVGIATVISSPKASVPNSPPLAFQISSGQMNNNANNPQFGGPVVSMTTFPWTHHNNNSNSSSNNNNNNNDQYTEPLNPSSFLSQAAASYPAFPWFPQNSFSESQLEQQQQPSQYYPPTNSTDYHNMMTMMLNNKPTPSPPHLFYGFNTPSNLVNPEQILTSSSAKKVIGTRKPSAKHRSSGSGGGNIIGVSSTPLSSTTKSKTSRHTTPRNKDRKSRMPPKSASSSLSDISYIREAESTDSTHSFEYLHPIHLNKLRRAINPDEDTPSTSPSGAGMYRTLDPIQTNALSDAVNMMSFASSLEEFATEFSPTSDSAIDFAESDFSSKGAKNNKNNSDNNNNNTSPIAASTGAELRAKVDAPRNTGLRWTPQEDELLRQAVAANNEINWRVIAESVPGRTHIQCLQRWKKALKPGLVKGAWSPAEDKTLIDLVQSSEAINWTDISTSIPGRTAKQCRERWSHCLDPSISRDSWSDYEDQILVRNIAAVGSRWSIVKKDLPGRTENCVKTRARTLIRRFAKSANVFSDDVQFLLEKTVEKTVLLLLQQGKDLSKSTSVDVLAIPEVYSALTELARQLQIEKNDLSYSREVLIARLKECTLPNKDFIRAIINQNKLN